MQDAREGLEDGASVREVYSPEEISLRIITKIIEAHEGVECQSSQQLKDSGYQCEIEQNILVQEFLELYASLSAEHQIILSRAIRVLSRVS